MVLVAAGASQWPNVLTAATLGLALVLRVAKLDWSCRRMVFVEFAKEQGDDQDGYGREADGFAATF